MNTITTLAELTDLLTRFNIPVDRWGKGGMKTLNHLLDEILAGECYMDQTDSRLIRRVRCSGVRVYTQVYEKTLHLVEDRQEFSDGETRRRPPPARMSVVEKIIPTDYFPVMAAQRALCEELGMPHADTGHGMSFIDTYTVGPAPSESYPELMCIYEFNVYEWEMPHEHYRDGGYVEIQSDKKTFFEWREAH